VQPRCGIATALLLAVLLAALLCSCGTRPTVDPHGGPAVDPVVIATWHGQPRAVAAKLLLKTTDAKGESLQTTLNLWRAADGRARLLLTKMDVDVLQVLIQANGTFVAWAPRSGLKATGDLADPTLPPALADVRLLLSEVVDGPLPSSAKLTPGSAPGVFSGTNGSYQLTVTLSLGDPEVRDKQLSDAAGHALYHLTYQRYQAFDDLHRPTRVQVDLPEGGSLVAHLLRCESLGDISAERMRLAIPDAARAATLTDFLEHLDQ
jgi:hypothetical protein